MKHRLCGVLAVTQLLGTWIGVAQTGTHASAERQPSVARVEGSPAAYLKGTTNPVIAISPRNLDFGSLTSGRTRTLSFTVQNTGGGLLSGEASVSEPFNIVGGNTYMLRNSQTKVITVRYAAEVTGVHLAAVHLTGGTGASLTVTGSATPPLPRAPARPRGPASSQNLRLIAGR